MSEHRPITDKTAGPDLTEPKRPRAHKRQQRTIDLPSGGSITLTLTDVDVLNLADPEQSYVLALVHMIAHPNCLAQTGVRPSAEQSWFSSPGVILGTVESRPLGPDDDYSIL